MRADGAVQPVGAGQGGQGGVVQAEEAAGVRSLRCVSDGLRLFQGTEFSAAAGRPAPELGSRASSWRAASDTLAFGSAGLELPF